MTATKSEPGMRCRICENESSQRVHSVREMMFGHREAFEYLECGRCGCLQIIQVPVELNRYYGPGYYSFKDPRRGRTKGYLKRLRSRYSLTGKGVLGRALTWYFGDPLAVQWVKEWLAYAQVTTDYSILDVGCGKARTFPDLIDVGFSRVLGIDPFLDQDISFSGGVKARKIDIRDINGVFDFVMMNHSFEHMSDPLDTLKHVYRVLAPGRFALIRTPVASSYAWRTYGVCWVQLDAPRHLFVHTVQSMQILAQQSGFTIRHIVFDSDEFQFWGSEQNRMDIPLHDPRSLFMNKRSPLFSKKTLAAFAERAKALNEKNDGDSAAFYLYKQA